MSPKFSDCRVQLDYASSVRVIKCTFVASMRLSYAHRLLPTLVEGSIQLGNSRLGLGGSRSGAGLLLACRRDCRFLGIFEFCEHQTASRFERADLAVCFCQLFAARGNWIKTCSHDTYSSCLMVSSRCLSCRLTSCISNSRPSLRLRRSTSACRRTNSAFSCNATSCVIFLI